MSSFDDQNPFQSPIAETGPPRVEDTETESIRKRHLAHEASIQSMGVLYYLGSVLFAIYFVVMFFVVVNTVLSGPDAFEQEFLLPLAGMTTLCGFLASAQFWVAWGLRRLRSSVRIPAILFSVIGLLAFPIGTVVSLYFLWLLASKKGAYVFTKEYREIIEATPYIKYRTSLVSWIFLALIVTFVILAIVSLTVLEN